MKTAGRGDVAPDLVGAADAIAARGIALGRPLSLMGDTESTNDDAKSAARGGAEHGAVFVAEQQTRGRGRQGRVWISPRGENLLFSVLLRVACPPARVPGLSLASGLAVRDAVARALGDGSSARVLVKWPNDVVIAGAGAGGGPPLRKVAGILVESALAGTRVEYVVVGIGINVHTRDFPDELRSIATSIARESTGASALDRAEILADVLTGLDRDVEHVAQRGLGLVHGRLSSHDALAGRHVETDDATLTGVACGIDPDGRLLVRRDDGSVARVTAGEVRLRAARAEG